MKALDILQRMVEALFLQSRWRKPGNPGEVVSSLSEEQRETLKELKSDDFADLHVPWYECVGKNEDTENNGLVKSEKLKFDRALLRKKR